MTTEEVKKIEEILADEEFLKNLSEAKTDDEVKNLMATKGIIMTEQDMADYKKAAAETAEKLSKMSPEELENISGGDKETVINNLAVGTLAGGIVGLIGGEIAGIITASKQKTSFKEHFKTIGKQALTGLAVGAASGFATGGAISSGLSFSRNQ